MTHHLPSFSDVKAWFGDLWAFMKIILFALLFGFDFLVIAFLLSVTHSIFSVPSFLASELVVLVTANYIREKRQIKNRQKGHDGIYEKAEKERAKNRRA
jgi:hypothetical protein